MIISPKFTHFHSILIKTPIFVIDFHIMWIYSLQVLLVKNRLIISQNLISSLWNLHAGPRLHLLSRSSFYFQFLLQFVEFAVGLFVEALVLRVVSPELLILLVNIYLLILQPPIKTPHVLPQPLHLPTQHHNRLIFRVKLFGQLIDYKLVFSLDQFDFLV